MAEMPEMSGTFSGLSKDPRYNLPWHSAIQHISHYFFNIAKPNGFR
jgi:hypothetical protein